MKSIVVYYSLEGNTERVAQVISRILGSDLLRLDPVKKYHSGRVSKYLGGIDAIRKAEPKLAPYTFDASGYDAVIIGTPVWAGKCAPAINTFLEENDLAGSRAAVYCTSASGNGESCLDMMAQKIQMRAHSENESGEKISRLSLREVGETISGVMMKEIEGFCLAVLGAFKTEEWWDLYDADGNLTDKKMKRGEKIPEGYYHKVISVWLKGSDGRYLMSKRSADKRWCPGMWECTGGAVDMGETSVEGAVREVKEELGIDLDPDKGRLVRHVRNEELKDFYDAWMFDIDAGIDELVLQESEVSEVAWMTPEEIDKLWDDGKLHVLLYYYKEVI